jgi:tetratricopeptide (TPR) repeat protein
MPGGEGKRSVYAFAEELNAWAAAGRTVEERTPPPVAPPAVPPTVHPPRRSWAAIAAVAAVIAITGAFWLLRSSRSADLPADPRVAALYVQGRDHWAQRDAQSLSRAIGEFESVVAADPNFAPAFSALADAYLLAREFGAVPDPVAFDRARRAAERAGQIDPRLASAHRATGFVAYWWERDRGKAGNAFRRALALDPGDGQTRFWYGNILADNGEGAAAMREFDAARLTEPGSVAIATDRAWAQWSAGDTAAAQAGLTSILSRSPRFAVALDCLGIIRFGDGDDAGYLDALRRRQAAQGSPALAAQVAALESALKSGGAPAMRRAMIEQALEEQREASVPDHSWAAFVASVAGDRDTLLTILGIADRGREVWGSAGYTRRMESRWRDDAEIVALLKRRAPPRIET